MNKILISIKRGVKKNYLAILISILVGLIYVAPNLIFITSLGENYRGIPMMQTANEDFYLARIKEILDGYPAVGSFVFFDYKDQWPLSPPTGEFFYALPALLFGVSPVNIIIISRFILPAVLFLLVYALISRLTGESVFLANKFNALAGGLWVILGYDSINLRGIWNFLAGKQDILAGSFLLWARPVNPILGAIFLFSFLLLLLALWQKTKYRKTSIIFAGLFLALMISSYFFSWGMALSIWGVLTLIVLTKREWQTVKLFFWVLFVGLLFASPYFYISWQVSQSPWYKDSILRNGLFYTHYPLLNKLMLAVLALYLILAIWSLFMKSRPVIFSRDYFKKVFSSFQTWHWFCLAFILGALWAYSQQIITGATIWPYHFVQYSIPLAMVTIMVLLFNIIKEKSIYLWGAIVGLIIVASLLYGIFTQTSVYRNNVFYNTEIQSYVDIFNWLNQQSKDCAVLVKLDTEKADVFDKLIPAFTHCNGFISTAGSFSLLPEDRLLFNYLVFLRLNDVRPENIESYLAKNQSEAKSRLFSNWKGLYDMKDFPDFRDLLLEERIKQFPEDYKEFMTKNFVTELKRYRLDYILSIGPLPEFILKDLSSAELTEKLGETYIYQLKP